MIYYVFNKVFVSSWFFKIFLDQPIITYLNVMSSKSSGKSNPSKSPTKATTQSKKEQNASNQNNQQEIKEQSPPPVCFIISLNEALF